MLHGLATFAGGVHAATGGSHDHGLATGQAHGALVGVLEGAAGLRQAVDPGLELAGDGEVVQRRANHDHVGGQELAHQRLGQGVFIAFHLGRSGLAGAETQRLGRQVRRRLLCQVQVLHGGARVGGLPGGHGAGGQLAGHGLITGDGRVNVKQLHEGTPWVLWIGATACGHGMNCGDGSIC